MKKTYITPVFNTIRIESVQMMATSGDGIDVDNENTITSGNQGGFTFNSNSFKGGLLDEE